MNWTNFCAFFGLILVTLVESRVSPNVIDQHVSVFIQKVAPHRDHIKEWAIGMVSDGPSLSADYLSCDVCHPALQLVRPLIKLGVTVEEIAIAISKVCELFDLAPQDDICYETIKGYVVPIVYMLKNKATLTDNDFCGLINKDCGGVNATFTSWKVQVQGNRPKFVERPLLPAGVGRTKILQFTDVHLDLDYMIGKNTQCGYPICCREKNGDPTEERFKAGPYGSNRCGLPFTGMDELFKKAAKDHSDAKYIFLTGDYIHAGVWEYGIESNTRIMKNMTLTLRDAFPNTVIIPMTGNHETDIVNMYAPPEEYREFPLDWVYTVMSEPFKQHMGGADQVATFKRGGFYTVSPENGLRFIILNTNLCYIQNFWLPYDPIDPAGQLKWFSETLEVAEASGENVYIIAHIAPGPSECWPYWSSQYDRVITRYSHIIRMQLFGHSHNEYYTVAFDRDVTDSRKPVSVSHIAPSAIADGGGMAYKVYYVDGERKLDSTWELIDHETYMLNSSESNIQDKPIWYKLFSFSQEFDFKSHRPQEYYDLTLRMIEDPELFEKFRRYYRMNDHDNNFSTCEDHACVSEIICDTVLHNAADRVLCDELSVKVKNFYEGGGKSSSLSLIPSIATSLYLILLCFLL